MKERVDAMADEEKLAILSEKFDMSWNSAQRSLLTQSTAAECARLAVQHWHGEV